MGDSVRYLPRDLHERLRFVLSEAALAALDYGDGVWKLERLLEKAFAAGYEDGYGRGRGAGYEHGRHDAKPVDAEILPARPDPAYRCTAHGTAACGWCSLSDPAGINEDGTCSGCSIFGEHGVHWDTCPNRVISIRALPAPVTPSLADHRQVATMETALLAAVVYVAGGRVEVPDDVMRIIGRSTHRLERRRSDRDNTLTVRLIDPVPPASPSAATVAASAPDRWEDQLSDALEDRMVPGEVPDNSDWIRARDIVVDVIRGWMAGERTEQAERAAQLEHGAQSEWGDDDTWSSRCTHDRITAALLWQAGGRVDVPRRVISGLGAEPVMSRVYNVDRMNYTFRLVSPTPPEEEPRG